MQAQFIQGTLKWNKFAPAGTQVALTGDNCTTNKATANNLEVLLIGSHNHQLNIGVEASTEKHLCTEQAQVSEVMSKLRQLKAAGRLRLTTMLKLMQRNKTRWTGAVRVFKCFKRFMDERAVMRSDADFKDVMPSARLCSTPSR